MHVILKYFLVLAIIYAIFYAVLWPSYGNINNENQLKVPNSGPNERRPSLNSIQTIVISAKDFANSVGGIRMEQLYPHQRYKVRVSAKNALGAGPFSSDVVVMIYVTRHNFINIKVLCC